MRPKKSKPKPAPECPACGRREAVANCYMNVWGCLECEIKFIGRSVRPDDPTTTLLRDAPLVSRHDARAMAAEKSA